MERLKPRFMDDCNALHYNEVVANTQMTQQLTLRLPAPLAQRLERAAREMKRKRSDVVRLALEQFLITAGARAYRRPADLVRDLVGSIDTGIPDLGQRHREHLLQRLRRDR